MAIFRISVSISFFQILLLFGLDDKNDRDELSKLCQITTTKTLTKKNNLFFK